MSNRDDMDRQRDLQAGQQAAQSSANELQRMGIDPAAVGLPPAPSSAEKTQEIRPVESKPAENRAHAHQPRQAPPMPPGARSGQWVPLTPPGGQQPPPRPSATALTRPLGPAQRQQGPQAALQTVANTEPRLLVPQGWRRLLRSVTFGLITPGATETAERERLLLGRVRARQQQPRVIAAVSGKGGVGTTTTAAMVSIVLAALRHDQIVLADAQSGTTSLGGKLAGQPAPRSVQILDAPRNNRPPPLRAAGGLHIVDGAPRHDHITRQELLRLVDLLRGHHTFTVLDVGDDPTDAADAALLRADQLVLVTTATQDAVQSANNVLTRLDALEARRLIARLVIAVVCLPGTSHREVTRELRKRFGERTGRIIAVPFDSQLARGGTLSPAGVSPRTRESYLEIAAQLAQS
jgi:MinD-like ATPase involved in chromosome partitioning or flagellar assembly